MIDAQESMGHYFSTTTQITGHWAQNLKRTNSSFIELWTNDEWECLLTFEQCFLEVYPKLTKWKHEPPKAPLIFELESYQVLKGAVLELLNNLT